jgi:hypothetical protein
MTSRYRWLPVLLAVCATTACLQQENHHTLYLSPDGSVRWMALQQDVRSDESDPEKRLAEERQFLQAATTGTHAIATGLSVLGSSDVRTLILRSDRPFMVATEARFDSIDVLARRALQELQIQGSATLTRSGDRTTFTLHLVALDDDTGRGPETPVTALVEDLDRYRIVLTDGAFTGADGFALQSGDSVAVPIERDVDAIRAAGGRLDLSLTWMTPVQKGR